MAAAVRNKANNPPRKGAGLPDNNPPRRTAWPRNANPPASVYTPPSAAQSPRLANQFPPLGGQPNGGAAPDTPLPPLSLIGSTILITTRSGQRYEASLVAVPTSSDAEPSLQLKDVKDLTNPNAPIKESFTLPATNLAHWNNAPPIDSAPKTNGSDFRTDTDISAGSGLLRRERELQAWQPDSTTLVPPSVGGNVRGDEATFGPGSNAPNGSWDQFEANEIMFGVKTTFDEEVYTTKIDRNTPGFKEKERKAQALANEIMGTATTNPHLAEERNLSVDDSGVNEEDKYAGVVRGANAYVPPGARRAGSGNNIPQLSKSSSSTNAAATTAEIPKVSVTDSTTVPASKSTSPTPSTQAAPDLIPTFRDFVTSEKNRLTQKRQALVKGEMDKRMHELVQFSQSFKLNQPVPEDLVPILAKDEEKQKQIREKSSRDAASAAARTIAMTHSISSPITIRPTPTTSKPVAPTKSNTNTSTNVSSGTSVQTTATTAKKESTTARISMVIQPIPPFNAKKGKVNAQAAAGQEDKKEENKGGKVATTASPEQVPKLNANASPFRLKPNAPSFKPIVSSPSPKSKPVEPPAAPVPPNPFFGARALKKGAPVHVKEDFNPFKSGNGKVPEIISIGSVWPYTGKRLMQMYPTTPLPQAAQPIVQPPPPPPPPYEEDAHARGYGMVYAYAPYAYPGQPPHQQPMMGPPGAYVPSPFLQPMHYPPMPQNGHQAMYAPPPAMGSMPPPQQYMQPPPGSYPPPNGTGPGRGSMPPTPMPPHTHAYAYHPSPQLSHAVPYQMMMPPPPNGPPHNSYESGPPQQVPMGGAGPGHA